MKGLFTAKKTVVIFMLLLPLTIFASELKGDITVSANNFRSDKGNMLITLFISADGFPGDQKKAYKKATGKIKRGKCEIIFTELPYGEYAISIVHDENSNGVMDTNFLGIPREGNGNSNNPEKAFGAPKFKDAEFRLNVESLNIDININY